MPSTRIWSCHYLSPNKNWTWVWKPAILVEDSQEVTVALATGDVLGIRAAMFDRSTGEPLLGAALEICVDRFCNQDDCGPMNLIAEISDE